MKKVEVATKGRGFLNELYDYSFDTFKFINNRETTEVTGEGHSFVRKLFYSKLFDILGVIQLVNCETSYDAAISYNRFLKISKPYYIICENPTALYHYKLSRKNGLFARYLIKKKISDDNLKGIICMSKACYNTFEKLIGYECGSKLYQIYPLIQDSKESRKKSINFNDKLKCLYISSVFELKGGGEIVEAAKQLPNVEFTVVTRRATVQPEMQKKIENQRNITVIEFNLSKKELYSLYDSCDLLLHPTRQDSLALVVLEAIKHGLPILATSIYAIPEMVENDVNGFLVEPKYWFFDRENMPNPEVWNNREKTIYSHYIDDNIVQFLTEKIRMIEENRNLLKKLSDGSARKAEDIFSEKIIKSQWENLMG